ncbi:hypothetical protein GWK16_09915 [Roseomonas sp. JC162]|uniref:Tetratricopeptide repeat protein n=1 Tax=Neoroseomonas marina TaxID=1232220 RepID=A0A848EDH2_9PROT|nr:hypothetical protein [Neoroseomonas marina]NMJ41557.1 hypothetical protein [Neoroseomonas marina]
MQILRVSGRHLRAWLVLTSLVLAFATASFASMPSEQVRGFTDEANPWGIAISPDGTRIAVSVLTGDDQRGQQAWFQLRRVAIHDAQDGRLLRVVGPDFTPSGPFAFTPDGRHLLTVRRCLTEEECRRPYNPETPVLIVATNLETGAEDVRHASRLGSFNSLVYDSRNPRRLLASGSSFINNQFSSFLATIELPLAVGEASKEEVLHRWRQGDGYVRAALGGSIDTQVLFSGGASDYTIPGLPNEVRALPPVGRLGTLRLFTWTAGAPGAAPRVAVVPLGLKERPSWRIALPFAASADGQRILLAATVPGRSILSYGAGIGSFGLSTDLFLLEDGRATRLTRLCGIIQHAAITPDGRTAAIMAGYALTRQRTFTPSEIYAFRVDDAAGPHGSLPVPSGILATRFGSSVEEVSARQSEAACSETWPDPPAGRISASELLRRVSLIAERRSIADSDAIRDALQVHLDPAPTTSAGYTRYDLRGEDIAFIPTERNAYGNSYSRTDQRIQNGAATSYALSLRLAYSGPCVTTQDVVAALGAGFRDERDPFGGPVLLHHMHGRPVGEGRSDVQTMVYDLSSGTTDLKLKFVFGMERCAESLEFRQSSRIVSTSLETPLARQCRNAPSIECLVQVGLSASSDVMPEAAFSELALGLARAGRIFEAKDLAARISTSWTRERSLGLIAETEVLAAARADPSRAADLTFVEATAAQAQNPSQARLLLYGRIARDLVGTERVDPPIGYVAERLGALLRGNPPREANATLNEIVSRWRAMIPSLPSSSRDLRVATQQGAQQMLAPILLAQGDRAGAEAALESAIAIGGMLPHIVAEGWAHLGNAERTMAIEDGLSPPRPTTYTTLAAAMRRNGDPHDEILPILRRAFEVSSGIPVEIIRSVRDLGYPGEACGMAEAASLRISAAPRATQSALSATVAEIWLDLGDRTAASRFLTQAIDLRDPTTPMAYTTAIGLYRLGDRQRFEDVVAMLNRQGRMSLWQSLLRDPRIEVNREWVERGEEGGEDTRAFLVATLALRYLGEHRHAEAGAAAREAYQAYQRISREDISRHAALLRIDSFLSDAASLAWASGDQELAAEIMRRLVAVAFQGGPNAAANLVQVAVFWKRRMPELTL